MIEIEQTENEIHPQFLLKGRKILKIYTIELKQKISTILNISIIHFRKALTHEHVFETIASVGRARSYRTAAQRWSGIRMLFKTGQIQPSLSDDRYKTVVEFQSLRQKNTCLMSSRVMRFGNDTYSDSFIQRVLQNQLSSPIKGVLNGLHSFAGLSKICHDFSNKAVLKLK